MNKKSLLFAFAAMVAIASGIALQQYLKPDFQTLSGDSYQWRDFKGEWVVVNYFAEWCAPCLREIPELNEFDEATHSKDIKLFGISFDKEPDPKLAELAEKYDIRFDLISADYPPLMKNSQPNSLPATFIISPEGEVKKRLLGEQSSEKLLATIKALESL